MKKYKRECKICGENIFYKTKHGYDNANKNNSSCGVCSRKYKKIIDETGNRYGKLLVLERYEENNDKGIQWVCLCDCGEKVIRTGSSLRRNKKLKLNSRCDKCNGFDYGVSALNSFFKDYMSGSEKRGLEFNLSKEVFNDLIFSNCAYCGKPPSDIKYKRLKGGIKVNGIDRVDNNIGYLKENCVPCCKECNYRKWVSNKKEFLEWIKRVYEHNF
jgi:hypothetical protein